MRDIEPPPVPVGCRGPARRGCWVALCLVLGMVAVGGCGWFQNREKTKHKEVYAEYLARVEWAFHYAQSDENKKENFVPLNSHDQSNPAMAMDDSNNESQKLLKDLDLLKRLEPLDDKEQEIRRQITESSLLLNYYLSYRMLGPMIFVNMDPIAQARLGLQKVNSVEEMRNLVSQRIEAAWRLMEAW